MVLPRKKVLMAVIQYWDSPFQVGSHHLARQFVLAGWDVAFISAPLTPFHLTASKDVDASSRFSIYKAGGKEDFDGRLWSYIPFSLIAPDVRPVLRSKWIAENWHRFTYPSLLKKIKNAGFGDVDLLYLDSIFQPFWLTEISYKKSVLRVQDANSGFPGFGKGLKRVECNIAQAVNSVIYTAKTLETYVRKLHPIKSSYVPNGVNSNFFISGCHEAPIEYEDILSPIAVYAGAMGDWFDFDLMNDVARALPDISFVLIGPDTLAKKRIPQRSNVHILGPKKYQDLPAYLHYADVGIIPFNAIGMAQLIKFVNPLKLYEYMACGLPVVSVAWDELHLLASPAILCETAEEFINAIQMTINTPQDNSVFTGYAKEHDWTKSFEKILRSIGEE